VADPAKRITVEKMRVHPWMAKPLQNDAKLEKVKTKLFKYVSVRKDKSQKVNKDRPVNAEHDMYD